MSVEQIKQEVNKAIVDYVEERQNHNMLAKKIAPYAVAHVFDELKKNDEEELIAIIDEAADIDYYKSQINYNPLDPGSVDRVLKDYYLKIKK